MRKMSLIDRMLWWLFPPTKDNNHHVAAQHHNREVFRRAIEASYPTLRLTGDSCGMDRWRLVYRGERCQLIIRSRDFEVEATVVLDGSRRNLFFGPGVRWFQDEPVPSRIYAACERAVGA